MAAGLNEEATMSKIDGGMIWDEAFRRAAEGCDPKEHLRGMIQEILDSLVADGSIETVGLNSAGKTVYRAKSLP
jgi:hypothetical protein